MVRFTRLALAVTLGALALPAFAEDKPTLTVYTYDAFAAEWGPGPKLKAGFEATCGCTLDFFAADSSIGALRRVQLEGATTKADIVLGLDTSLTDQAEKTGLFAKSEVDTHGLDLPIEWVDPIFVPFDQGFFAFVYNKEKLPDPPTSFEKLAFRDPSFKIIIEDPRSDTPGLGLVLWLKAAYHGDTDEAWAEIAPHVLTMTKSWSEAYNLFLNGEADMVLSYTTSPAYHRIAENDDRYAAAMFSEGHYAQIEVAGLLETSPNKALARQFLTYLISPEAQAILPTTNWMYPVRDIGDALPAGFDPKLPADKVLLMDPARVGANADAWVAEALAALR